MSSVERRDVMRNLPKKGFEKRDGHHIYFHLVVDGKITGIKTWVSHSASVKTISGGLLTAMKKQLRLERTSDFVDLIACPMTGEQFIRILRENGHL
jgi:hypothetical protein